MKSDTPDLASIFAWSITQDPDAADMARDFPPETSEDDLIACAKKAAGACAKKAAEAERKARIKITATRVLSYLCQKSQENANIAFIKLHEEISQKARILEEDFQALQILFKATVMRFDSKWFSRTKYDEKSHMMELALDGLGKALDMQNRFDKLRETHSEVVDEARRVAEAALKCSSILSKTGDSPQDGGSQTGAKRPADEALDILDSVKDVSKVLCRCEESDIPNALEYLTGTSVAAKRRRAS
jgi:hypothetical protein